MAFRCDAPELARRILVVCGVLLALAAAPGAWAQGSPDGGDSGQGLSPERAKALSDLLNDPEARGAIVQELDRIAASEAPASAEPQAEAQPPDQSIGRQIAETTQAIAEQAVNRSILFVEQLSRAPRAMSAIGSVRAEVVWQAVVDLLLVVATTIVLFIVLRRLAKRLFLRMGAAAGTAGSLRTVLIILASVLIDAGVVLLAWAGGYALALLAFGELGSIGIRQTLYLNAFLMVELAKVLMRAVLSPSSTALRPVGIPDKGARVLSGWLNLAVSLIGYGQLLIVPIINENVSIFAGRGVSTLLSLLAVAILIGLVLAYRRPVANWLLGDRALEQRSRFARFLARFWHVPVLIYLFGLFAIVLARPGGILVPLLIVSLQVVALAIAGLVLNNFLKRATRRGVHLPPSINQRLPLLERRLNSFVPNALAFIRLIIVIVIVAVSFQLIGAFDVEAWLSGQFGARFTGTLISVVFILLMAFLVWLALSSWIDYRLNPDYGSVPTSRERTLLSLLKNAATIMLIVITAMFVLSDIGIDIAPLLASAGVLGLAIGFGAQKMVQDIITGVFIQFENAINVGDVVTVGGTTGTVERLTIRSVSLRDLQGVFHIIPFSSVDMVSNYMRDFSYFLCDMGVAYRENVGEVKQAMLDAFTELREMEPWKDFILEDLQWFGLQSFGDSAIVLRARIKTVPGQQWAVGRAYNEILKRVFDERGIEIPFPHQTLYFGEDKEGKAPPLRILSAKQSGDARAEAKAEANDSATEEHSEPRPGPVPDDAGDGEGRG